MAASEITLIIGGPIARADVPGLCERARAVLEGSDAGLVTCDVGALAHPDAAAVDALARLQLVAMRLGRQVRLRRASRELEELLAFMGLSDVVPLCVGLGLAPSRQAEEREHPRRVEEEGHPTDPVA